MRRPAPFAKLLHRAGPIAGRRALALIAPAMVLLAAPVAFAQDRALPYWASLNRPQAIMRRGPSPDMRALWEYRRMRLPVRIVAVRDDWRQVEMPDGTVGWMHKRLLSGRRTAIVTGNRPQVIHTGARANTPVAWRAAPGVVGMLGSCDGSWCEIDVAGRKGWISTAAIWGD